MENLCRHGEEFLVKREGVYVIQNVPLISINES